MATNEKICDDSLAPATASKIPAPGSSGSQDRFLLDRREIDTKSSHRLQEIMFVLGHDGGLGPNDLTSNDSTVGKAAAQQIRRSRYECDVGGEKHR